MADLKQAAQEALEFMNADRRDNVIFAYLPVSVVDALRAAYRVDCRQAAKKDAAP